MSINATEVRMNELNNKFLDQSIKNTEDKIVILDLIKELQSAANNNLDGSRAILAAVKILTDRLDIACKTIDTLSNRIDIANKRIRLLEQDK